MRLVRPSLGECVDRIVILNLKIENSGEHKAYHFIAERDAIHEYLLHKNIRKLPQYEELCQVNRELWDLLGGIRQSDHWKHSLDVAASVIQREIDLNNRRAALVSEIDGGPREKLY